MKAIWAIVFLFICGAALLGLFVSFSIDRDAKISRDIAFITPGLPAGEAVRLLGTPSWRSQCGSRFPYKQNANCVEELVYSSSLSFIIPSYHVIEVGQDGRVLSVGLIQSH